MQTANIMTEHIPEIPEGDKLYQGSEQDLSGDTILRPVEEISKPDEIEAVRELVEKDVQTILGSFLNPSEE